MITQVQNKLGAQALCDTCINCEADYRLQGHEYRQVPVCAYDLSTFPKAMKCPQFEYDNAFGSDDLEAA